MQMTFRWYGEDDPVTLEQIRQIPGVTGVVTAIYDIPVGQVWSEERIARLVKTVNDKGLECKVIESVPVHEDIKTGSGRRDEYIQNYCRTLRNLGNAGVEVVCYNFMPVFDWTRSSLDNKNADGSTSLVYHDSEVERMNPLSGDLALPGWDSSYTKDGLQALLKTYQGISHEDLWENLRYFLEKVIPVAQEAGIKMAIHPDDPPWDIFGLPRIITNEANLERFLKLVDSPANGLTLCSGSLGADPNNDIPALIRRFGDRIHFGHCRNIKITGAHSFDETGHLSSEGSLDMYEIMKAYHDIGFDGPIRPDHGRMVWGEQGRPGYGLYDRALGAAYLNGLWEAIDKEEKK